MPFEFFCPNGHRIAGPEDRTGHEGKCPKCGVMFRIPAVSGGTATKILAGGIDLSGAPTEADVDATASTADLDENNIVFLCPNGHRLNGPARLQGQAGQCPHCGAKFLVPILSEMESVEEVDLTDIADDEQGPLPMVEDTPAAPLPMHPLCRLMRKLWDEKQHGAVVELHLESGAMLTPDWFDDRMSRQSHGLFAAQAADGTVTMTVVAWDRVSRVVVRNVEGLPEGMFE